MNITDQIKALYAALPPHPTEPRVPPIEPWIGADYITAPAGRLRVMIVGINSYISEEDLPARSDWFSHWARDRKWRFFVGSAREADVLVAGMIGQLGANSFEYDGDAGRYVTNVVKRYLPAAEGAKAHQVDAHWFGEGREVFKEELRLLARANALPHVILVFGKRAWAPVHRPLQELCAADEEESFVAYRPMSEGSALYHHLNVIELDFAGMDSRLILLRLDHPSTSRTRTAAAMLKEKEFQLVVGEFGRGGGKVG